VVFLRRQDVRGVGVVEVDVGSEFDLVLSESKRLSKLSVLCLSDPDHDCTTENWSPYLSPRFGILNIVLRDIKMEKTDLDENRCPKELCLYNDQMYKLCLIRMLYLYLSLFVDLNACRN